MSTVRLPRQYLSPRYLSLKRPSRPILPSRQFLLHRTNTTSTNTSPSTSPAGPETPQPPPPTSPPKPLPRYRRALLYALLSLALGASAGSFVSHTIAPPPHPLPGSHEDKILVHDLQTRIDEEFKVKVLRGKCLATGRKLKGEEGDWREISGEEVGRMTGWDGVVAELDRKEGLRQQADALGVSYRSETGGEGRRYERLTGQTMAGARALGAERLFWNAKDKELVAVVWLGGGLSGWPGVVHGGAIASVMGEKSGLAVRLDQVSRDGKEVKGEEEGLPEWKSVEFNYKKPTYANRFYVVRILPHGVEGDGTGVLGKMLGGEVDVDGRLETMDGVTCVEMKAVLPTHKSDTIASKTEEAVKPIKKWFG